MNRNPIGQKALSLLLSLTLVLSIFGVDTVGAFAAQVSTLVIDSRWCSGINSFDISQYDTVQLPSTSPTAHTTLTADGGNVTIVGQNGVTYQYLTILIKDSAKVIIQNLSIQNESTDDNPAVDVQSADDGNTLYIDSGFCTLQGGLYQPGIRVEGSNQITIDKAPGVTDDNAAALDVSSSWFAAAIGGGSSSTGDGSNCGTVNIKGEKSALAPAGIIPSPATVRTLAAAVAASPETAARSISPAESLRQRAAYSVAQALEEGWEVNPPATAARST